MPSREAELYKDKIEVSLDGRQIFYLFFGGAVIVGLVFVLGVMVGRRVEARGHIDRARTTAAADPLAALDRLEGNTLSFQGALTGGSAPSEVERKIDAIERARGGVAPGQLALVPEAKVVTPAAKPAKPEPAAKPEPEDAADKADEADEAEETKKVEAKADTPDEADDDDDEADDDDDDDDEPVTKPEKKPAAKAPARTYTIQLASFQDKTEAEALSAALAAAGHKPYITQAEVAGKKYYRVRLGTFTSTEAADAARPALEKITNQSSNVVRL